MSPNVYAWGAIRQDCLREGASKSAPSFFCLVPDKKKVFSSTRKGMRRVMENIRRIAFDMNREQDRCETCKGTKLEGGGRRGESNASDATVPPSPCGYCLGRGYLWYEKRSSLSIPRPLDSGITEERMVELWEQRHRSN